MGSSTSVLLVQGQGVSAGGSAVGRSADHTALTNIQRFGMCSSSSNLGNGGRSGAPCAPAIVSPWIGSPSVSAGGLPVLTTASQCHCQYGGTISVVSPGQFNVTAS
jgi:hypothetical protein